jgi:hypothetical protein
MLTCRFTSSHAGNGKKSDTVSANVITDHIYLVLFPINHIRNYVTNDNRNLNESKYPKGEDLKMREK